MRRNLSFEKLTFCRCCFVRIFLVRKVGWNLSKDQCWNSRLKKLINCFHSDWRSHNLDSKWSYPWFKLLKTIWEIWNLWSKLDNFSSWVSIVSCGPDKNGPYMEKQIKFSAKLYNRLNLALCSQTWILL